MQIVYYKDPIGNFGDDLNELMWPRLLPDDVRDAPHAVMVGIGSLIDQRQFRNIDLQGKRVYVMGAGAAYGRLPEMMDDWRFLAVRGKLTARLVGRPEASVTDGAALLAKLPELLPQASRRDQIMFMPHHRSAPGSNWPSVAREAGMNYVDPQWPTERILAHYARARLVVTEAMHGAIVADTLRIPWIPVMISPQLSVFKWRDWLSSLELPYLPVGLPTSGRLETAKYSRIVRLETATGRTVADIDAAAMDEDLLIEDFTRRYATVPDAMIPPAASSGVKALAKLIVPLFDTAKIATAVKALRAAAAGKTFLSRDGIFHDRVGALERGLEELIAGVRAG